MPFSYWPGGIPSYVKFDGVPTADDKVDELTNGWKLFVKEKWIPKPSGEASQEYEANQRRALVSEWIQAPQTLRDQFHARALESPPVWNNRAVKQYFPRGDVSSLSWYTCIAPLDTPRNRALWTKLRILSYDFYDSNDGICEVGVLEASPHSATAGVEPKDFMKAGFVENADFNWMYMTVHATVTFKGLNQWVFADQRSLEDGMLLIVNIESNGDVVLNMRPSVLELNYLYNMHYGLAKGLAEIRGNAGFDGVHADVDEGEYGQRFGLDISKPILEIFADVKATGHLEQGPDEWPALIEQNAP
ncbi:hypothetical protein VF21_06788 [Pseudogymnoascus sp. 05NY08]|nr:hypothetical protein VF21_06788 [Pseudogymnoascus sp. 05NY08]